MLLSHGYSRVCANSRDGGCSAQQVCRRHLRPPSSADRWRWRTTQRDKDPLQRASEQPDHVHTGLNHPVSPQVGEASQCVLSVSGGLEGGRCQS